MVIAALLVGATVPVMAAVSERVTTDRAAAPVDAHLARQLAEGTSTDLAVMVRGTSHEAAADAARRAGLRVATALERIDTVVAIGNAAQVTRLLTDRSVLRVTGDRPITFDQQTSHKATRGEDAARGFAGYYQEPRPPMPGKKKQTCRNVRQTRNGKTRTVRRCTTRTAPPTPVPPLERAVDVQGVDGAGVSIAVVDSGVDGTHPMFMVDGTSRVVRNLRLSCAFVILANPPCNTGASVQEDPSGAFVDMTDEYNHSDFAFAGHGTHVASIAAGGQVTTDTGRRLHGAATGAKVVALGMGANSSIIAANLALEWVLENHRAPCGPDVGADVCPPIKVVNNSWGSDPAAHDPEDPNALLSNELVAEGLVVVFAHGNDGGDGTTNNANPEAQNPTPGVIAVASVDDGGTGTRDVTVSSFSSRGKQGEGWTYPDISAPGSDILGACRAYMNPIYGCNSLDVSDSDYGTISGTSMAAPHISGIVAQLFQAAARAGITLTPEAVERLLESTAYKFGGPYEVDADGRPKSSFDRGYGLVDAKAAVAALLGLYLKDPGAPAPDAACVAGQVAVDAEGDGSTRSVDVINTAIAWDAAATTLTFTTRVKDLGSGAPTGYTGEAFYVDFVLGGKPYWIGATRSLTEPAGASFGRTEPTGPSTVRRALSSEAMTATFDAAAETVTVTLGQAALDDANESTLNEEGNPVPPLADGLRLGDISVETNLTRDVAGTGLLQDGDVAQSGCDYVLATGAAVAPAPPAAPEVPPGTGGPPPDVATQGEASLADGGSASFEGAPAELQVNHACSGPGDPLCFTYAIDVSPADGEGTLAAVVDALPAADYDLYVYDAALKEVGAGLGTPLTVLEETEVEVKPGRYYVVVQPFTAGPDTPFTLEVSLT